MECLSRFKKGVRNLEKLKTSKKRTGSRERKTKVEVVRLRVIDLLSKYLAVPLLVKL